MIRAPRDLRQLHADMIKAQKAGDDFDLTFREIMATWGIRSVSQVYLYMNQMIDRGMVKFKQHGRHKSYRAVELPTVIGD